MSVAHSRGGSRHPACGVSCWFRAEKSWVREQESWLSKFECASACVSEAKGMYYSSSLLHEVCIVPRRLRSTRCDLLRKCRAYTNMSHLFFFFDLYSTHTRHFLVVPRDREPYSIHPCRVRTLCKNSAGADLACMSRRHGLEVSRDVNARGVCFRLQLSNPTTTILARAKSRHCRRNLLQGVPSATGRMNEKRLMYG